MTDSRQPSPDEVRALVARIVDQTLESGSAEAAPSDGRTVVAIAGDHGGWRMKDAIGAWAAYWAEQLGSKDPVQVYEAERSLSIVAKMTVDLADVYMNVDDAIEAALDRCKHVSLYLLERAATWLDEF